jgi:FKBP-type peptidyl-prolyl cis-trans isomerases 1
VRKTLPIVLVASAALLLAGCSGSPSGSGDSANAKGCSAAASGSVSQSIKVTGSGSAEPKVTFAKPLTTKKTERSYVKTGKGSPATKNHVVEVALVAYNGTTGKKLTSNGYGGSAEIPVTVGDASMIPGLTDAIECAPVGSRLVTAAPVSVAFGSADPTSLGLKKTDTIVFVADLRSVVPTKADGTPQTPKAGFPTVVLDKTGQPTVTIPKTDPPKTTQVEVLKKGAGETVKSGDTVTVQYQGVNWRTRGVFDQSWGRAVATFPTTSVVKGFATGMVGQTVGSQVVVVIPPADGYGKAGNTQAGIKGTDTLVFVIDILNTSR